MEAAVASHPGLIRDSNEDRYLLDSGRVLYVISDGMGGHQAGEIASQIAVEVIGRALSPTSATSQLPPDQRLREALHAAHEAIREAATEDASRTGMGATAVAAWVPPPGGVLWIAHVGDSRAYLLRAGQLKQLTEDHTLLNQALRAGVLPANREAWPPRNILSQSLGCEGLIAPDIARLILQTGDLILLCTDGLTDMLDDGEIARLLSASARPSVLCEALVREANRHGGRDNITLIVIRVIAGP